MDIGTARDGLFNSTIFLYPFRVLDKHAPRPVLDLSEGVINGARRCRFEISCCKIFVSYGTICCLHNAVRGGGGGQKKCQKCIT